MPLQRFKPSSGRCKLCSGEVEIALAGAPPAEMECPKCGQRVELRPSLSAAPAKILRRPGASEAKAAGFHTFKRVDRDVFERQ